MVGKRPCGIILYMQKYIEKIKEILIKHKNIDYAVLFGSTVKNKTSAESDIDILLKADLAPLERIDLSMELELTLKKKVDIVLIKDASHELILNAFSKGTPILITDMESLKKDYFKNFYLYEDGENIRKLRILRIKRRLAHGG